MAWSIRTSKSFCLGSKLHFGRFVENRLIDHDSVFIGTMMLLDEGANWPTAVPFADILATVARRLPRR